MKRRGAPGEPVSKLDVLRARAALHDRRRPLDSSLIGRCRYQAEHGPPVGGEWEGRTWPSTGELSELVGQIEAIDERGKSP
jgi:hypothetical protein